MHNKDDFKQLPSCDTSSQKNFNLQMSLFSSIKLDLLALGTQTLQKRHIFSACPTWHQECKLMEEHWLHAHVV